MDTQSLRVAFKEQFGREYHGSDADIDRASLTYQENAKNNPNWDMLSEMNQINLTMNQCLYLTLPSGTQIEIQVYESESMISIIRKAGAPAWSSEEGVSRVVPVTELCRTPEDTSYQGIYREALGECVEGDGYENEWIQANPLVDPNLISY